MRESEDGCHAAGFEGPRLHCSHRELGYSYKTPTPQAVCQGIITFTPLHIRSHVTTQRRILPQSPPSILLIGTTLVSRQAALQTGQFGLPRSINFLMQS